MAITLVGEPLFAKRPDGRLVSHIATLFPFQRVLVTIPGIHATQRIEYVSHVNAGLAAKSLPPMTRQAECDACASAVDLIVEDGLVLIRPDPARMPLAFAADEMLQELVSKRNIKFLHAMDPGVQQAIRERGELWRISALPHSVDEMKRMILRSKIAIHNHPIYYFNALTGTRFVTCAEFAGLEGLPPDALAGQLSEIRNLSGRSNAAGFPEVKFVTSLEGFDASDLAGREFTSERPDVLMKAYRELLARFRSVTSVEMQTDDPDDIEWRNHMFSLLAFADKEDVTDEILCGLSPEYFMQIRWLPGARFEGGELIFDPVFDELDRDPGDVDLQSLCDQRTRSFIGNLIREFGSLDHVNIGRVAPSITRYPHGRSGHSVFIAEVKPIHSPTPVVRILRMQKWGIVQHLDEGKDLLRAIMESEEYTDYILNRRLGCWQLGMRLCNGISTHKIAERYGGKRGELHGTPIWSTYFERDYLRGMATDKIPQVKYDDAVFCSALASLLGRAAAPNIIVGRLDDAGKTVFDNGDEILILDDKGTPVELIAADHSGTFADSETPLEHFASDYAIPVNSRATHLADAASFARIYLDTFRTRFRHIREEYRKRRRAFDSLFKHCKQDQGSFSWRWHKALERLDRTDPDALAAAIKEWIKT